MCECQLAIQCSRQMYYDDKKMSYVCPSVRRYILLIKMNARFLYVSCIFPAINTANSLTEGEEAPAEPPAEAPLAAAVSAAVTQAVSQAVSHAVSQAVSQEIAAPVHRLTDMSDSDLLSYINPSTFDQGEF